jgi:hypothetical protein
MLTPREFLGDETYRAWLTDYEGMRALRNAASKSRPSAEQISELQVNKPWERFYRAVLFGER